MLVKTKKLLLITNPCSGLKAGKRYLADILALFCNAGYVPTVFITNAPQHGKRLAATHAAAHDLVVCMGGDGTFNEMVSGLMQLPECPEATPPSAISPAAAPMISPPVCI